MTHVNPNSQVWPKQRPKPHGNLPVEHRRQAYTPFAFIVLALFPFCAATAAPATPPMAAAPMAAAPPASPATPSKSIHTISFSHQVRPILQRRCQGCHQPNFRGGKLSLASYQGLMEGGASGPAFHAGDPSASKLVQYITGNPPPMPKNQPPLSAADVSIIRQWIQQGGKDDTPVVKDPIDSAHPPVYHTAPVVSAMAFSPDGQMLAVSGYREVLLHHGDGSGLISRLVGRSPSIESVAFSSDGSMLAAVGGAPGLFGEIQIWDPAHARLIRSIDAGNDTVFGASFSPDGKKIAVGGADNSVRVFNVADGTQIIKFDNHSDWVFGTAFTQDSQHLVTASRDQAIKLILLESPAGSFIDDINTHHAAVRCLVRLPKEDKVLCGEDDGVLRLYQVFRTKVRTMNNEDYNLLREFPALPAVISAVAVSPDGTRAAVGDIAGNLRVFNVADGKLLFSFKNYAGGIFALAFQSDSKEFAASGFDGKVRIFAPTGRVLASFIPAPITAQIAAAK